MKNYFTKDYKSFIILLGITFLFVWLFIYMSYRYLENKQYYNNYIDSINDSVLIWKDKYNKEHAKISIIETNSVKQFLQLNSKDSIIKELQSLVNSYKSKGLQNATIIKTETSIDTILINKKDSIFYHTDVNLNGWIYGYINTFVDSTQINLKVKNDYSIVQGIDRSGFKRKPYVEIINHNPYSETKVLRTYQIKSNEKRFSIGPQIGYGLVINNKPSFYVGIGLQYNLISF